MITDITQRVFNPGRIQQTSADCKLFHDFRPAFGYTRTWQPPAEVMPVYLPLIPMSQRSARTPDSSCNLLPWQRAAAPVRS